MVLDLPIDQLLGLHMDQALSHHPLEPSGARKVPAGAGRPEMSFVAVRSGPIQIRGRGRRDVREELLETTDA
jgi:hypothetical protein